MAGDVSGLSVGKIRNESMLKGQHLLPKAIKLL
jgi:hypothetical protein